MAFNPFHTFRKNSKITDGGSDDLRHVHIRSVVRRRQRPRLLRLGLPVFGGADSRDPVLVTIDGVTTTTANCAKSG